MTETNKNNATTIFLAINVMAPLIVGGVFYYLYSPDVIFVKTTNELLGIRNSWLTPPLNAPLFNLVRNYGLDLLWAYSLVGFLHLIIDNKVRKATLCILLTTALGCVLEVFQALGLVKGTADLGDVVAEAAGALFAVFIIKIYLWRKYHEKN